MNPDTRRGLLYTRRELLQARLRRGTQGLGTPMQPHDHRQLERDLAEIDRELERLDTEHPPPPALPKRKDVDGE